MTDLAMVLLFALLPAAGNVVGGLLAEVFPVSRTSLSLALHGAAGVVLGVVGVELLPQALQVDPPWLMIVAFVAGGLFFVGVDRSVQLLSARSGRSEFSSATSIYAGVTIDLLSDGIMIGAGSALSPGLGLLLALGQVPADLPEGYATIAGFKRSGVRRRTRILLAASFVLPIVFGAVVGFLAVRDQGPEVKLSILAFTAGVLTTLVVEEIVPESHYDGEAYVAALAFIGGFALFALLSLYFG